MSTEPSSPNPVGASPVRALMAISRFPATNRMRGGVVPSPGQNATPRAAVLPVGSLYSQISLPVAASSARTRLPAGRYITLLMTMGVASGFTVGAGAAPRPPPPRPACAGAAAGASPRCAGAGVAPRPVGALLKRYDHASFTLETLVALSWLS